MHIPWLTIARIGSTIAGAIVPGVAQVEQAAEGLGRAKGVEKQEAVVNLVKAALATSEELAHRDLLNDPEVEQATRAAIDAVIAVHHAVAKATIAAPGR